MIQFGEGPLSQEQLNRFVPFTKRAKLEEFKQKKPLNVYVINSDQIQKLIVESEYVWIHKWRPFCSAKSCQFISPFEKKARDNNVTLSIISETNDLEYIDTIVSRSQYSLPIYFGWPYYYSNRIGKARKLMKADLMKNQNVKAKKFADDYLYKNGSLIFQGDDLLDSLEIIIKRNK